MKRILITVAIALLIFNSCSKSGSDSNYHVSFSVNGSNKTYTGYVLAHMDTAAGYITLTVIGSGSAFSFDNFFGFYLDNYSGGNPIVPGQYLDTSTDFTLLASYTSTSIEHEAGQSVADDAAFYNIPITHFKINIIAMDANTIRGTFSGDFFTGGDVQNGMKVSITNGVFYVKFQ